MPIIGNSIQDVIALADRMASTPADAVAMSGTLVDCIRALPPPSGALLSRPRFDRASLWTLGTTFENVAVGVQQPPQIIRCQHDVWIRSVQAQAYPRLEPFDANFNSLSLIVQLFRSLVFTVGTNGRGLFKANWRLDARQGFITTGQSEVLAPAASITGDGRYPAPKDWMLQKDQTLEIRVESTLQDFELGVADAALILRYLVVTFWAEETDQPSQQ